jgi:uncharacterized membrane protein
MTNNGALKIESKWCSDGDFHMGAQGSLPAFVSLAAILVLRRNPRKAQASKRFQTQCKKLSMLI